MAIIKICGFTRRKDIEDAVALGVDMLGVNFVSSSPRFVSPKDARQLFSGLPVGVLKVGVFVNPSEKFLFETSKILALDGIQLHGNEPPWLITKIKKRLSRPVFVIKALRIKDAESLGRLKDYKPDYFLFDSYVENLPGGTGQAIDAGILEMKGLPWRKVFLAGGITPENVSGVIEKFNPFGIDVASGAEIAPGVKDREKMEQIVVQVKGLKNNDA